MTRAIDSYQMTVRITRALREEMAVYERRDVSWSQVAAAAFRAKLSELRGSKSLEQRVRDIEERLKMSSAVDFSPRSTQEQNQQDPT